MAYQKWESHKNQEQWDRAHKIYKKLKNNGIDIKTRDIKRGIPKSLTTTSKVLGATSGFIVVGQVIYEGEIRASHVLDATMTGLSFIPVAGWAIGGSYFVADWIHRFVFNESIGDRLDRKVGTPLLKF